MYPWKSSIKIDRTQKRAQYLQIADSIINEVSRSRIQTGSRLPGSRELSVLLGVNRKTVQLSYDELLAQGWIEVRPSKGTFVKESLPITNPKGLRAEPKKVRPEKAEHVRTKIIGSINDGTPDYRIAPLDTLYKYCRTVTKGLIGKSVLEGDHSLGEITLRTILTKYLQETRAISCNTENVMITRGSQMAIHLAFSQILKKGGQVLVGELNYQTANETIEHVGGECIKVTVNNHGLSIEHIRSILSKKKYDIKALYISPHHHYPSTVTMPIEHRLKLLELANEHDFIIVEDDYDYDYHYQRSPILPIASIDQREKVIYLGSFSKMLSSSIRIGYMLAPEEFLKKCKEERMLLDRRGDPIIERALAEMIKHGEIQRHLKKAVKLYHERRDLMVSLLTKELKDEIDFQVPEGGMSIWVRFRNIEVKELINKARTIGLGLYLDTYSERKSCRLGFASMNEEEMTRNIKLLSQCLN